MRSLVMTRISLHLKSRLLKNRLNVATAIECSDRCVDCALVVFKCIHHTLLTFMWRLDRPPVDCPMKAAMTILL